MLLKTILNDFCGSTSSHGLPHIGSAENGCLRVFWGLVFLAGTGVFVWQMTILVEQYLEYEFNLETKLSTDMRVFPAVTVCSLNPYRNNAIGNTPMGQLMEEYKKALKEMPTTPSEANIENSTYSSTYGSTYSSVNKKTYSSSYSSTYNPINNSTNSNPVNNSTYSNPVIKSPFGLVGLSERTQIQAKAEDMLIYLAASDPALRDKASYPKNQFINSCVFNTQNCDKDVQLYMDPVYGACYTFNNKTDPYTSIRSGPTYGVRLLIINEQSKYLPMTEMAGVRVSIQSPGEPAIPDAFGYNAAPGYTSSFAISYTTLNRAGAPYDDCTDATAETTSYGGYYTNEACRRSCFQKYILGNCSCLYARFATPPETKAVYCGTTKMSCVNKVITLAAGDTCGCTRPCKEDTYDVSVSPAIWPGTYKPNACPSPLDTSVSEDMDKCVEWYGNNTMMIEVFYESLSYLVLTEFPAYTVLNFISDIGGQMGLWLGFSIITVCEFFALCCSMLFCCCLNPKKND